jgi:hypothetical protein
VEFETLEFEKHVLFVVDERSLIIINICNCERIHLDQIDLENYKLLLLDTYISLLGHVVGGGVSCVAIAIIITTTTGPAASAACYLVCESKSLINVFNNLEDSS